MCAEYGIAIDLTTGILLDERGAHQQSAAILRIIPYLDFPYNKIGSLSLRIPGFISDVPYKAFARNRGTIWTGVKRLTGSSDPNMTTYRDRIFGLEDPLDSTWGF